ncbi:LysR family transcriptional regulator [Pelagibaculum spongiae]|uniref:LysR family transcriptional regulator n=1 Tax=Pelagibaculum spongiae TaxID=2080658 RepID=A0A2V1GZW0_9GAMM|nr:LysR family transcriptional regulator [Pelagibaculum spongiae]PVZ70474.1 LysR family transcriptional regulator [Pelagibaculum spongiae]
MHPLATTDLNLLVALQALLKTHNVTKAAVELGITQSAMSRTLQRLRATFNDPLFVRTREGLKPTARAEALVGELGQTLDSVGQLLASPTFDPSTARGSFRVLTNDFGSQVFMPNIMSELSREAPGMNFEIVSRRSDMMDQLQQGQVDLILATLDQQIPAEIYARTLGEDRFVCVMRYNHPLASKKLTLNEYCDARHILITTGNDRRGHIDLQLAKQGLKRNIVLRLPHFTAAPSIAANSDLIVTMPRGLALRQAQTLGLKLVEPPVNHEPFAYHLVWHSRQHHNPAHKWLRDLMSNSIRKTLQEAPEPIDPLRGWVDLFKPEINFFPEEVPENIVEELQG